MPSVGCNVWDGYCRYLWNDLINHSYQIAIFQLLRVAGTLALESHIKLRGFFSLVISNFFLSLSPTFKHFSFIHLYVVSLAHKIHIFIMNWTTYPHEIIVVSHVYCRELSFLLYYYCDTYIFFQGTGKGIHLIF